MMQTMLLYWPFPNMDCKDHSWLEKHQDFFVYSITMVYRETITSQVGLQRCGRLWVLPTDFQQVNFGL